MRIVRFILIVLAVLIASIMPSEAQIASRGIPMDSRINGILGQMGQQPAPQPAPKRKERTPEEERAIYNDWRRLIEKNRLFSLPPEKADALIDAHERKYRLGIYSDEE